MILLSCSIHHCAWAVLKGVYPLILWFIGAVITMFLFARRTYKRDSSNNDATGRD